MSRQKKAFLTSYRINENIPKESNLLSGDLIAHLELKHIREEHTACLTQLMASRWVPTTLDEWMEVGLDIGFPDNSVWLPVAHTLEGMSYKVEETVKQHEDTQERIKTLKHELHQLEAQQAQSAQWAQPLARLQSQCGHARSGATAQSSGTRAVSTSHATVYGVCSPSLR